MAESTDTTIQRFIDAASEMGRYLAALDADRDEFADAGVRLKAAYKILADRKEEAALVALLASEDPYVCLFSAKMLLLTDEKRAVGALEKQGSSDAHSNAASHARLLLKQWGWGRHWVFPIVPDTDVEGFERAVYEALAKAEAGKRREVKDP